MREADATQWSVAMRTVVIDSFSRSAVGAGAETVLTLGAGLDARPYRMDLPSELRWIEIDYPSVVDQKDAALRDETPRCRVERIGLNLAQIHERRDLFERIDADSSVTVVPTEGVVPYLTNDEAGALAEDLRARPSFSAWIIDYFAPVLLEYLRKRRRHSAFTFSFEPGDWERFFVDRGWSVAEMRYLGEESLRLGRHVPMPLAARLMRLGMPPARRREMSRMNGYALLEPTDGVARPLR